MFRPGSILWLLRHEMRMAWRESRTDKGRIVGLIALGVLFVMAAGGGIAMGIAIRNSDWRLIPAAVLIIDAVVAVIFTLMLSQTLAAASQALFVRADLDLLFSSPMPPRTVLTVRFAGIALNVAMFYLVLLGAFLVPIAITGTPQWLGALAVVLSLALLASAAGLLLTTALFRVLGPRRTRTVAQVLAMLVGASLFLATQIGQFLDRDHDSRGRFNFMADLVEGKTSIPLPSWADFPARAAVGEPLPLLALVGGSLLIFLTVNQLLGRRFARDAATAIGSTAVRKARGKTGAFAEGAFAATLRKELRLLVRDIALLSQVGLRVLFMLPLAFVLLRNAHSGVNILLPGGAAALALVAGQVVASLAWITISAEDAPDLLVASPAPLGVVNRAKLWAALIPTAALLIVPLILLTIMAPAAGLAATAGCAASGWTAGLISIWHQRPGKRADFRRRGNLHWMIALAIFAIGGLISAATFLAAWLQPWAIIPAVLAAVFTLALRKSDKAILETLRG